MEDRMPRRDLTDVEAVKAMAHPRRQGIMQYLSRHSPSTSAAVARALGLNTGATSYHLRELAKHGLIEEAPELAHGRERWWRRVRADYRIPRWSQQSPEMRQALGEFERLAYASDLEAFARFQSKRDELGEWGDALPYSRGTVRVTLTELMAFFEEYLALLKRFSPPPEEASPGAREVLARFIAFPAVADDDGDTTGDDSDTTGDSEETGDGDHETSDQTDDETGDHRDEKETPGQPG